MAGWALRTSRRRERYLMLTVLKTLIQPRLDYCCQLWSPTDQSSINKVENIQRNFISHIKDSQMTGLNYWEKLSHLNIYSQERRRERFDIIFLWKLSQGLAEGYDVTWSYSERRGRMAVPKTIVKNIPAKVRRMRESSFGVRGPLLFNLLPKNLRNENSGDLLLFKNHLDIFLSTIPDQPTTPGLIRAANSNSLLDQIPLVSMAD